MSSADDVVENIIGRFGKYQLWIFFFIFLGRAPTDYQIINVTFLIPSVEYVCMDESAYNLTNHCPCDIPQYDQNTIQNSVTSEWNLICDQKHLASWAQSMLHVGILAGSIFYGHVSDRYGRKLACSIALFAEAFFVALSAASSELWMFMVFRFLIGTAVGGTMLCSYVLLIELIGKSFRPYLPGLTGIPYVLTNFTLPIIAYYLRDWRHLQLATSVPWLLVVLYFFFIPESPRWLITVGQKERAIEVLTNIAEKNNRPTKDIRKIVEKVIEETITSNGIRHGSFLDLFKTGKVRLYTFITAFIWMFSSHTFYGMSQYIGRLQGSIYLNVMFSALSLIPGLILVVFATLYLRRKVSVIVTFSIAGISLLMIATIPNNRVFQLVLAIIGYSSSYLAFIQMYLYCSEVFPTVIRNSALGFASVFARFGGFIAPFVVNIGINWISTAIFSTLAFLAGILCYFLPETKDTVLLNTIAQREKK